MKIFSHFALVFAPLVFVVSAENGSSLRVTIQNKVNPAHDKCEQAAADAANIYRKCDDKSLRPVTVLGSEGVKHFCHISPLGGGVTPHKYDGFTTYTKGKKGMQCLFTKAPAPPKQKPAPKQKPPPKKGKTDRAK